MAGAVAGPALQPVQPVPAAWDDWLNKVVVLARDWTVAICDLHTKKRPIGTLALPPRCISRPATPNRNGLCPATGQLSPPRRRKNANNTKPPPGEKAMIRYIFGRQLLEDAL